MLIGLSAIATEAALWYLGREQAYAAADAAALAGAVQYANDASSSDAEAAATTVANLNGFGQGAIAGSASTSVAANNPPSTGNYAAGAPFATPSATEVIVNVGYHTYLSSLFHAADIDVGVRAVAAAKQTATACALSLTGDMTINNSVLASACYLASNATDSSAVTVPSSVSLVIKGITTEGNCQGDGCPAGNGLWGNPGGVSRPTATYQLPTLNPLSALGTSINVTQIVCPPHGSTFYNWTDPSTQWTNDCVTSSSQAAVTIGLTSTSAAPMTLPPTQPDPTIAGPAQSACSTNDPAPGSDICAYYNMDITIGPSVVLQPGTYLLVNSNLRVPAGTQLSCSATTTVFGDTVNQCGLQNQGTGTGFVGVTFIFAGASGGSGGGTLYIDPAASVTLTASGEAINPVGVSGSLNGILFYRDSSLPQDTGSMASVQITGDNTSLFDGLMYFPNANALFAGNTLNQPNCAIVIAQSVTIGASGGSGSVRLNDSCSAYNLLQLQPTPQLPTVQAASLVE
jgi:hypothetical protein